MATQPRRSRRGPQPVEVDGDDLLPVPGAAAPGRSGIDPLDDDGAEAEPVPQTSRASRELAAQMRARNSNKPIFPYPPELPEDLKPYWVELVNSFQEDHFQVSDITFMKMYCQCAFDIERQNVMIEEEGEVVIGGRGPIVNPRCKVRDSNRAALMTLATKFRNQPASRTNTENFTGRQQKAAKASNAASTVDRDDDGLLAGKTRH